MELEIQIEELRKRKIFIATPMYGGMCGGQYTKATIDLATLLTKYQIPHVSYFIFNESLITRARNYLVDEFLRSDATHLMFIDSDIGYQPDDVVALLAIADPDPDKEMDIVCAPYPKKTIAWEKIKAAVDKGVADENPNVLANYVGDFVFNPARGQTQIKIDEPVEVMEGGTGFMMIQRRTFERFAEAYPDLAYRPDHVRTKHFDGKRKIHAYFDCIITPPIAIWKDGKKERGADVVGQDTKDGKVVYQCTEYETGEPLTLTEDQVVRWEGNRYLSEDYMFCQYARDAGMKVWMCPWIRLNHTGSYVFGGSLSHLAQIGAAPTADPAELKGKK